MRAALVALVLLLGCGGAPAPDSTPCVYEWKYPDGRVWAVDYFWPDAGEDCPARVQ